MDTVEIIKYARDRMTSVLVSAGFRPDMAIGITYAILMGDTLTAINDENAGDRIPNVINELYFEALDQMGEY